jgi:hypothetical protein
MNNDVDAPAPSHLETWEINSAINNSPSESSHFQIHTKATHLPALTPVMRDSNNAMG